MIARLSGTVWSSGENYVVVRVGGIGLQVHTPSNVLVQLDGVGQLAELFTYLHVRENELTLYGFLTEDELTLFKLLLGVSGVGPKAALALLGTISPDALRQAVVQEEPGLLSRVPGIGPKRRQALLQAFGSIDGIRKASLEELTSIPGLTSTIAQRLRDQL